MGTVTIRVWPETKKRIEELCEVPGQASMAVKVHDVVKRVKEEQP